MRRLVALAGIFSLTFQVNPAVAKESFDLNEFQQIDTSHPDYKLKIMACDLYGKQNSLRERWAEKGGKSAMFTNEKYSEISPVLNRIVGSDKAKLMADPRLQPWIKSLTSSATEDLEVQKLLACGEFLRATARTLGEAMGEALDQKGLEKFDSINANHPDFKSKIAACWIFDTASAGFEEKHTGNPTISIIFEDEDHEKITQKMFRFLGRNYENYLKEGSEAYALSKKLFLSSARELLGQEAVRQVCFSAFLDMEKSMNNESQPESSQNGNNSDAHTDCLQAKDYEGCMRFNQSKSVQPQAVDPCEGVACLVRTKTNDVYGLPKPWNYLYRQLEDGRLIYWSSFYRVPHKGQEARYIAIKRITRYYRTPEAGTSGSFIGGGSASTNCIDYGGSINCSTTGSSPTYIPGRSATPGGIVNAVFTKIFDCKDMTEATYKQGKLTGRWEKYDPEEYFNGLLKDKCDTGMSELKKLPILGLKL